MINAINEKLLSDINNLLQKSLNPDRLQHVLGVEKTSRLIGKQYNLDLNKLTIAALLHDIAKGYSSGKLMDYCNNKQIPIDSLEQNNHGLLHAKVARSIAEEIFHITDPEILNSINHHTTGRIAMSLYEETILVADYCEPNRDLHIKDKILETALHNLSQAVYMVIAEKMIYVIKDHGILHPKSIAVYNHYRQLIYHD